MPCCTFSLGRSDNIGGKSVCALCVTALVAYGSYYVYNKYYKVEAAVEEEKPVEQVAEEKPAEEIVEEKPAEEPAATPSA